MCFRIGCLNLNRHRKRTVFTALGLGVGYFAAVFISGWMNGIQAEMVENATSLVSGQIEIHSSSYRPERSLYETIGGRSGVNVEGLLRQVSSDPTVISAAPRVYVGGLISSGESTSAGMLMGIQPDLESTLSRFLNELVEGRLPEPGQNEILIGTEMARQLGVLIGNELVVVAPGADGSMGNDLFKVIGFFRTGLSEFDVGVGVMHLEDLQLLASLDRNRIHEVAVSTLSPSIAAETAERLRDTLASDEIEIAVEPWTELRPAIVEYVALMGSAHLIVFSIVFFIALFGVANTMLMATFERRREFAVMLALGTNPWEIVLIVVCEAVAIGLLSLLLGTVVTLPLMEWWQNAPLDLSRFYGDLNFLGSLVRPRLRVEYDMGILLQAAAMLLTTAVVASIYPAVKAAKVPPADTLSGL